MSGMQEKIARTTHEFQIELINAKKNFFFVLLISLALFHPGYE